MKILVTGSAGFIGSALAYQLAARGDSVVGIDNINDYYDPALKFGRLRHAGFDDSLIKVEASAVSSKFKSYRFVRLDITDKSGLDKLFADEGFDIVVHLAAQAGVRFSITNPYSYLHSNLEGFLNILEACRVYKVRHLIYASSSSVYGNNLQVPYSESHSTDSPVSLYAATKKSNELMAHAYSKLYGFATTGLRYFTVYGPWGRPDMSPVIFADAILKGKPIKVFNNGDMMRDFTYIDDIVDATVAVVDKQPKKNADDVFYNIYNIGGSNSVNLLDFISEIERACGKKAIKHLMPMQPGDVLRTVADSHNLEKEFGLRPSVPLSEGIDRFIHWFQSDENPLN